MIKAKEDTFHLGVKAIFRNPNKEMLLLERRSNFNQNYWDLPGGRLQKGESFGTSKLWGTDESEIPRIAIASI